MQGSLSVHSDLGRGSHFEVRLALPTTTAADPTVTPHDAMPLAYISSRPYQILTVDDRADNCAVLTGFLEPLGFAVITAEHGQDAWRILKHQPVDLVITDLIMPVMDGFQLLRQMKEDPQTWGIPVIASSASVIEFHRSKSFALGFIDFLPKPVEAKTLVSLLQQALHLTWIYPDPEAAPAPRPLVMPPAAALQPIYEAAAVGRMQAIATLATALADRDPDYLPFCDQILAWVNALDDEAIVTWLSPHL